MDHKPDNSSIEISVFIEHARQGTYFTVPFTMPSDVEGFAISYRYERYKHSEIQVEHGSFTSQKEINIIDLGLIDPHGKQVGASGSDKLGIHITETSATPGYIPIAPTVGEWQILVGAYKVADEGVNVSYKISFAFKRLRLYKGDLHTHTFGSDGVLALGELAQHCQRNGLDFLAVTDHNQMVSGDTLSQYPGITLIPGIEWTHYRGHANFLGVNRPYD